MKVRMIAHITGTRDGELWPAPGGVIDVPADEAESLVAAGMAAPVEKVAPEKASAPEPENAAAPKPRARRAAQA